MSLMDVQKIERDVDALLGVSGFRRDGAEQHLWLLLHHLYSAVAMYELMSAEDKVIIADTFKREKKNKKRKRRYAPTPPCQGKRK